MALPPHQPRPPPPLRPPLLALLLAALLAATAHALPLADLFPFGPAQGDDELAPGDDRSSPRIAAPSPLPFLGRPADVFFVNSNGVLSIDAPMTVHLSDRFPLAGPVLVAPFWGDVDTRGLAGPTENKIYFSLGAGAAVRDRMRDLVTSNFVWVAPAWRPAWVLVATWFRVGSFNSQTEHLNTFQCAIATDGNSTFAAFLYPDDGLEWAFGASSGGVSAQAGFNLGDGTVSFLLDGSLTTEVLTLADRSNTLQSGLWLFQLDGPEVVSGGCGNGQCQTGLGESCLNCPLDCGACCGNSICEPDRGESCLTCSTDCGLCSCGDGHCDLAGGESCLTCEADCGACCGDGLCDIAAAETCETCPRDCGSCCRDAVCSLIESCLTCPQDCGSCCGDGHCQTGLESCSTCPRDCGPCRPLEPDSPVRPRDGELAVPTVDGLVLSWPATPAATFYLIVISSSGIFNSTAPVLALPPVAANLHVSWQILPFSADGRPLDPAPALHGFTTAPLPDLVVTAFDLTSSAVRRSAVLVPGVPVRLSATVANRGSAPADLAPADCFYLVSGPNRTAELLASVPVPLLPMNLGPLGAAYTASATVLVAPDLVPGRDYEAAFAPGCGPLADFLFYDTPIVVEALASPDLVVVAAALERLDPLVAQVAVVWTVFNQGFQPVPASAAWSDRIDLVWEDPAATVALAPVVTSTLDQPLAPLAHHVFRWAGQLPTEVPEGPFSLRIDVNIDARLPELRADNNRIDVPASAFALAAPMALLHLEPVSLALPAAAPLLVPGPLRIRYGVRNPGPGFSTPPTAPWVDTVEIDCPDQLSRVFLATELFPLYPGDTYERLLDVQLPAIDDPAQCVVRVRPAGALASAAGALDLAPARVDLALNITAVAVAAAHLVPLLEVSFVLANLGPDPVPAGAAFVVTAVFEDPEVSRTVPLGMPALDTPHLASFVLPLCPPASLLLRFQVDVVAGCHDLGPANDAVATSIQVPMRGAPPPVGSVLVNATSAVPGTVSYALSGGAPLADLLSEARVRRTDVVVLSRFPSDPARAAPDTVVLSTAEVDAQTVVREADLALPEYAWGTYFLHVVIDLFDPARTDCAIEIPSAVPSAVPVAAPNPRPLPWLRPRNITASLAPDGRQLAVNYTVDNAGASMSLVGRPSWVDRVLVSSGDAPPCLECALPLVAPLALAHVVDTGASYRGAVRGTLPPDLVAPFLAAGRPPAVWVHVLPDAAGEFRLPGQAAPVITSDAPVVLDRFPMAELVLEPLDFAPIVSQGGTLLVPLRITNVGTAPTLASALRLAVTVQDMAVPDGVLVGAIDAGAVALLDLAVQIPLTVPADRTAQVEIVLDPTNAAGAGPPEARSPSTSIPVFVVGAADPDDGRRRRRVDPVAGPVLLPAAQREATRGQSFSVVVCAPDGRPVQLQLGPEAEPGGVPVAGDLVSPAETTVSFVVPAATVPSGPAFLVMVDADGNVAATLAVSVYDPPAAGDLRAESVAFASGVVSVTVGVLMFAHPTPIEVCHVVSVRDRLAPLAPAPIARLCTLVDPAAGTAQQLFAEAPADLVGIPNGVYDLVLAADPELAAFPHDPTRSDNVLVAPAAFRRDEPVDGRAFATLGPGVWDLGTPAAGAVLAVDVSLVSGPAATVAVAPPGHGRIGWTVASPHVVGSASLSDSAPNATLIVAAAKAAPYLLLADSHDNASVAVSTRTLSEPTLLRAVPEAARAGSGPVTFVANGGALLGSTSAFLVGADDARYPADAVRVLSDAEMAATFDTLPAEPGEYRLVVEGVSAGAPVVLSEAASALLDPGCDQLWLHARLPQRSGSGPLLLVADNPCAVDLPVHPVRIDLACDGGEPSRTWFALGLERAPPGTSVALAVAEEADVPLCNLFRVELRTGDGDAPLPALGPQLQAILGSTLTSAVDQLRRESHVLADAMDAVALHSLGTFPVLALEAHDDAPWFPVPFLRVYRQDLAFRDRRGPLGPGWRHSFQGSIAQLADGAGFRVLFGGQVVLFAGIGTQTPRYALDADGEHFVVRARRGPLELRFLRATGLLAAVDFGHSVATLSYAGDALELVCCAGACLSLLYGDGERLIAVGSPDAGRFTTYAYDDSLRLVGATFGAAAVAAESQRGPEYRYGAEGGALVAAVAMHGAGPSREYSYDAAGFLQTVSLVDGDPADPAAPRQRVHTVGRNFHGRWSSLVAPADGATLDLDSAGRVQRIVHGRAELVVERTRTGEVAATAIGRWRNDYSVRWTRKGTSVTEHSNPLGVVTRTERDLETQELVARVDGLGRELTADRSADGRTSVALDGEGLFECRQKGNATLVLPGAIASTYRLDGRLATREAGPLTITFGYAAGQPAAALAYATVWGPDRVDTVELGYDPAGRLATVQQKRSTGPGPYPAAVVTMEWTLDGRRAATRIDEPWGRVVATVEYDGFGRPSRVWNNSTDALLVQRTYDPDGRLQRQGATAFNYTATGQIACAWGWCVDHAPDTLRASGLRLADGAEYSVAHDAVGRLVSVRGTGPNGTVVFEAEYDAVGNRRRTVEQGVETVYRCNNRDQYVELLRSGAPSDRLAYDALGNLVEWESVGDGTSWTLAYDALGRLVGGNSTAGHAVDIEYSALGLPVRVGNRSLVWDPVDGVLLATDAEQYLYVPGERVPFAVVAADGATVPVAPGPFGWPGTLSPFGESAPHAHLGRGLVSLAPLPLLFDPTSAHGPKAGRIYSPALGRYVDGAPGIGLYAYGFRDNNPAGHHESPLLTGVPGASTSGAIAALAQSGLEAVLGGESRGPLTSLGEPAPVRDLETHAACWGAPPPPQDLFFQQGVARDLLDSATALLAEVLAPSREAWPQVFQAHSALLANETGAGLRIQPPAGLGPVGIVRPSGTHRVVVDFASAAALLVRVTPAQAVHDLRLVRWSLDGVAMQVDAAHAFLYTGIDVAGHADASTGQASLVLVAPVSGQLELAVAVDRSVSIVAESDGEMSAEAPVLVSNATVVSRARVARWVGAAEVQVEVAILARGVGLARVDVVVLSDTGERGYAVALPDTPAAAAVWVVVALPSAARNVTVASRAMDLAGTIEETDAAAPLAVMFDDAGCTCGGPARGVCVAEMSCACVAGVSGQDCSEPSADGRAEPVSLVVRPYVSGTEDEPVEFPFYVTQWRPGTRLAVRDLPDGLVVRHPESADAGGGVLMGHVNATGSLQLLARQDFAGSFAILVAAVLPDGTADPLWVQVAVTIAALADDPVLLEVRDATGDEDVPLALPLRGALADTDGSEALFFELDGVPRAAHFVDADPGCSGLVTCSPGAGSTTAMRCRIPAPCVNSTGLVPELDFAGEIHLEVRAVAVEASSASEGLSAVESMVLSIRAVADGPRILQVAQADLVEDGAVLLSELVSLAPGDTDGSETLGDELVVSGLPVGASLASNGSLIACGAGCMRVPLAEWESVVVRPAPDSDATMHLSVLATSLEVSNGRARNATGVIEAAVRAVADQPQAVLVRTVIDDGREDTPVAIEVSGELRDRDGSESIDFVRVDLLPEGAWVQGNVSTAADGSWATAPLGNGSVVVVPAADSAATFVVEVAVAAVERSNGDLAWSAPVLVTIIMEAVADLPVVAATGGGPVFEDNKVELASMVRVELADRDGSEELLDSVDVFVRGGFLVMASNLAGGGWRMSLERYATVLVASVQDSDVAMEVTVMAGSRELSNGETAVHNVTVTVPVEAVADPPSVRTLGEVVVGIEDEAALFNVTTAVEDTDGSERVFATVVGCLTDGATLVGWGPADEVLDASTLLLLEEKHGAALPWYAQLVGGDGQLEHEATVAVRGQSNFAGSVGACVAAVSVEASNGDRAVSDSLAAAVIEIEPVADGPQIALSGSEPHVAGVEDELIPIGSLVEVSLVDTDGSETIVSPLVVDAIPDGVVVQGAVSSCGSGCVEVGIDDFAGLQLLPRLNSDEPFNVTVVAATREEPEGLGLVRAVELVVDLVLRPVPDGAELASYAGAIPEDVATPLNIEWALIDSDGSEEVALVQVSAAPTGVLFFEDPSMETPVLFEDGVATVPDLGRNLTMLGPVDFSGAVEVVLVVGSREKRRPSEDDVALSQVTMLVLVEPVADRPMLTVPRTIRGVEDTALLLPIEATLQDLDGSETGVVVIDGLPAGVELGAGELTPFGRWQIDFGRLPDAILRLPADFSGDFVMCVEGVASEAGSSVSTGQTCPVVTIDAVADAPTVWVSQNVTQVREGRSLTVSVFVDTSDQDQSEFLESVTVALAGEASALALLAGGSVVERVEPGVDRWELSPGLFLAAPQGVEMTLDLPACDDADRRVEISAVSMESSNGDTESASHSVVARVQADDTPPAQGAVVLGFGAEPDGQVNVTVEWDLFEDPESPVEYQVAVGTAQDPESLIPFGVAERPLQWRLAAPVVGRLYLATVQARNCRGLETRSASQAASLERTEFVASPARPVEVVFAVPSRAQAGPDEFMVHILFPAGAVTAQTSFGVSVGAIDGTEPPAVLQEPSDMVYAGASFVIEALSGGGGDSGGGNGDGGDGDDGAGGDDDDDDDGSGGGADDDDDGVGPTQMPQGDDDFVLFEPLEMEVVLPAGRTFGELDVLLLNPRSQAWERAASTCNVEWRQQTSTSVAVRVCHLTQFAVYERSGGSAPAGPSPEMWVIIVGALCGVVLLGVGAVYGRRWMLRAKYVTPSSGGRPRSRSRNRSVSFGNVMFAEPPPIGRRGLQAGQGDGAEKMRNQMRRSASVPVLMGLGANISRQEFAAMSVAGLAEWMVSIGSEHPLPVLKDILSERGLTGRRVLEAPPEMLIRQLGAPLGRLVLASLPYGSDEDGPAMPQAQRRSLSLFPRTLTSDLNDDSDGQSGTELMPLVRGERSRSCSEYDGGSDGAPDGGELYASNLQAVPVLGPGSLLPASAANANLNDLRAMLRLGAASVFASTPPGHFPMPVPVGLEVVGPTRPRDGSLALTPAVVNNDPVRPSGMPIPALSLYPADGGPARDAFAVDSASVISVESEGDDTIYDTESPRPAGSILGQHGSTRNMRDVQRTESSAALAQSGTLSPLMAAQQGRRPSRSSDSSPRGGQGRMRRSVTGSVAPVSPAMSGGPLSPAASAATGGAPPALVLGRSATLSPTMPTRTLAGRRPSRSSGSSPGGPTRLGRSVTGGSTASFYTVPEGRDRYASVAERALRETLGGDDDDGGLASPRGSTRRPSTLEPFGGVASPKGSTRRPSTLEPFGGVSSPKGSMRRPSTLEPFGEVSSPKGSTRRPSTLEPADSLSSPRGSARRPSTLDPIDGVSSPKGSTRRPSNLPVVSRGSARRVSLDPEDDGAGFSMFQGRRVSLEPMEPTEDGAGVASPKSSVRRVSLEPFDGVTNRRGSFRSGRPPIKPGTGSQRRPAPDGDP